VRRAPAGRRASAAAALALALALPGCGTGSRPPWPGSAATHPGHGPGHLAVAADTAVLTLNLLIAERDHRLIAVTPRGQVVWRRRQADPGAVSVTRTGRTLVVAEPRADVVALRRVDSGQLSFVFGQRHRPGSGSGSLDDPQTAFETSDGAIAIADSGNCRVLLVEPGAHRAAPILGSGCAAARRGPGGGVPVAAVPAAGGSLLVTERAPARVELVSRAGAVLSSTPLRGLATPGVARLTPRGLIVVTDRARPGRVEELAKGSGAVRWRYAPHGASGELDDPAMALALADGDVLVVDSGNDRVIVIDPRDDAIVWQYGHTGVAGRTPGYLDRPQSATLVPVAR